MSLENYTGKVSDLVVTNPTGTDPRSQGDDHLRGIKLTLVGQSNQCQLGQNPAPANNFTFDATENNGTLKLGRGNAGAITQDIMTVDASGRVAFPQNKEPAVIAQLSAPLPLPTSPGWAPFACNSELFDTESCYDPSTGIFTPNVEGWYLLTLNASFTSPSTSAVGVCLMTSAAVVLAAQYLPINLANDGVRMSVALIGYFNGTTDNVRTGYLLAGTAGTMDAENSTRFAGSMIRGKN